MGRDLRSYNQKNPQTGTTNTTGYLDDAAVDLGNGIGALVVIQATRTKATVAASASSVQAFAADLTRIAGTILNNEPTSGGKTMYVGLNGAAAVAGTNPVLPQMPYNVPVAAITGQVQVIWDAGATQAASTIATTA